jgi:hypothetical protein
VCLEIVAIPGVAGKVSARALASVSGLTVTKADRALAGAFRFGREPGCSCSLLADEADWNAPVWALEPTVLEGLATAVELLATRAGGVRFQALWLGESLRSEGRIQLKELLRQIRRNNVWNRHAYLVGRSHE